MALTNLTPLTAAQYRALSITPFLKSPNRSSVGNPDSKISIQLGGWVGTNVLAFIVNDAVNTDSSVAIDPNNAYTLDITVMADGDPNAESTYWTVNMGTTGSGTNWGLSFQVDDGETDTGTWVFTKGSGDDDNVYN